jgi:hypothetical protein
MRLFLRFEGMCRFRAGQSLTSLPKAARFRLFAGVQPATSRRECADHMTGALFEPDQTARELLPSYSMFSYASYGQNLQDA